MLYFCIYKIVKYVYCVFNTNHHNNLYNENYTQLGKFALVLESASKILAGPHNIIFDERSLLTNETNKMSICNI